MQREKVLYFYNFLWLGNIVKVFHLQTQAIIYGKRNNLSKGRTNSSDDKSKHHGDKWIGSFTKELELGPNQKNFSVPRVVIRLLSCVWLFATAGTAARQASLSFPISQSLLKHTSIESVMPFSHPTLCCSLLLFPQSFPASESFPMSQLFSSGSQRIGASVSASVVLLNIQCWFPLELISLIPLLFKGLLRLFSNTTIQKHHVFSTQPS